jgi:hypothetical protein
MNQIYPDQGLVELLTRLVTPSVHYHLFTNNIIPDLSTTLGALVEAAWAGYAVVTVLPGAFTIGTVTAHVGTIIAAPISFFNTSGGDVTPYGYYVTDAGNTKLYAITLFSGAPITIPDGGSQQVVPIFGDFSRFALS